MVLIHSTEGRSFCGKRILPAREITNVALLGSRPNCLQGLFRKQPIEHLAAGQSLFLEGDTAKHLFEVIEGNLRIFRIISDGRRVITGIAYRRHRRRIVEEPLSL
ncbi:cyclic nucleotide-binding domain-containing protein [Rhizobium aouanii]|uniref:Cyclic nucleotide-binding domain-containing protein n=1 Tax=Rhizobium aouanii TaxID=3118145 RepID=A0ABU8CUS4_9HYPH